MTNSEARKRMAEQTPTDTVNGPQIANLDLDAIRARLTNANSLALDESVARWYRTDVPALLAEVERLWARPWKPSDGDSRCQECGMAYEPWVTNDRLWNRVMGGGETSYDPGGYLCPRCFAVRAARHVKVWHFEAEPSKTEVELRRALFHERENYARAEAAEARAAALEATLATVRAEHARDRERLAKVEALAKLQAVMARAQAWPDRAWLDVLAIIEPAALATTSEEAER